VRLFLECLPSRDHTGGSQCLAAGSLDECPRANSKLSVIKARSRHRNRTKGDSQEKPSLVGCDIVAE
jgi:hypothetical protein